MVTLDKGAERAAQIRHGRQSSRQSDRAKPPLAAERVFVRDAKYLIDLHGGAWRGEFVEGRTIVRGKSSRDRFQRMLQPTRAISFRLIMTQSNLAATPGRTKTSCEPRGERHHPP